MARILDVVLDLPPQERSAFLDQACADDGELRAEVEAMLAGAEADAFLKSPAVVLAAPILEGVEPRPSGCCSRAIARSPGWRAGTTP